MVVVVFGWWVWLVGCVLVCGWIWLECFCLVFLVWCVCCLLFRVFALCVLCWFWLVLLWVVVGVLMCSCSACCCCWCWFVGLILVLFWFVLLLVVCFLGVSLLVVWVWCVCCVLQLCSVYAVGGWGLGFGNCFGAGLFVCLGLCVLLLNYFGGYLGFGWVLLCGFVVYFCALFVVNVVLG